MIKEYYRLFASAFRCYFIQFKTVWLLLMTVPLTAVQCDKDSDYCHTHIPVHNSSDHNIYVFESQVYPDTMWYTTLSPAAYVHNELRNKVFSKSVNDNVLAAYLPRPVCWEKEFRRGGVSKDTLMIFVGNADLMEEAAKSGTHIWSDDMIIQRYDLSLPDLQKLNFQLPYPPTEAMRNMKMYPAYGKSK